ncbi:ornithine carbamoyltransferase, partial [Nocardia abscessus]
VIGYGPDDLQLNTGETLEDTIRVLSRMLDVLVVRTSLDSLALRAVAEAQEGMAVINAMSDDEHPTQALADLLTLRRYFGRIEGLKILYMGEGNNTASALGLAISRYPGAELHLRTPKGYGVPTQILAESNRQDRMGTVVEKHDLTDLPDEVHVVYTTRWQTTGTRKPDPHWKSTFSPFRVDERLMARYPDAIFMHDLPAHRGEEVDAAVIDGTRSIVFDQAAGKLYSAMAALEWCLSENECGSL